MATTSWRDRLSDWRNRLVADPAFQRWAAAFPLSRPVARAKARDLFDLQAGFIYSQITLAFVQLDLPSRLAAGPIGAAAVAEVGEMPVASAERLLRAAAVLGLVGLINLPIVKFSVDWWNTLHQPASLIRAGGPSVTGDLLAPLLTMMAAYGVLFLAIWVTSIRAEIVRRRVLAVRARRAMEA